jgi:hypothetical protein
LPVWIWRFDIKSLRLARNKYKLAFIQPAEAGASGAEIQAVTGKSARMVAYYRTRANKRALSKAAQERKSSKANFRPKAALRQNRRKCALRSFVHRTAKVGSPPILAKMTEASAHDGQGRLLQCAAKSSARTEQKRNVTL